MRNRKVWCLFGLTFVVLAIGLTTLAILAKHEPSFYRQTEAPPSKERKDLAFTFFRNFGQMMANRNALVSETWSCDATEAQVNSFFEEIFIEQGEAEGLRNLGISSPRVTFEEPPTDANGDPLPGGFARLAFRYGNGWFSTVISYELKIWLVPKEANTIGVEIRSARAGALPISKQSILNQLSDYARKQNFKVTIYRHEGNPVALIDLDGDQPHPKSMTTALQIGAGSLKIRGRTLEHAVVLPDPAKAARPLKAN
jgi:hypothetical protein